VRFLKFNRKKLDYILNLTHDGRVKSAGDFYGFTLKGNVQVPSGFSVITPAGNQVGPGDSFSVGNAMLEDGSKVTDFESFKQWLSSGKDTTSRYQILEVGEGDTSTYDGGFSQEYIEGTLSPGLAKVREKEHYASFVRDLIKDLKLFTNPDNLQKDLEKFNFLYGYYIQQADENNVDTDLITDVFNDYLVENLSNEIRNGSVAKFVYEGKSVNPPTDKTKEDEKKFAEHLEEVVEGTGNRFLKSVIFSGIKGFLGRICVMASEAFLTELKTRRDDPSLTKEEIERVDSAIKTVDSLSPRRHRNVLANFFGFSIEAISKTLASYRANGKQVFDEDGFVVSGYKSKINPTELFIHLLRAKIKNDLIDSGSSEEDAEKTSMSVYKTFYSFSMIRPFSLQDYVSEYANATFKTRKERIGARKNSKIVTDIDRSRVKLLKMPLDIRENGIPVREGGLSVAQILSHDDNGFRTLNARKALYQLKILPRPDNELDAIVLDLVISNLESHLNSKGIEQKIPPIEATGVEDIDSEKLDGYLEMYYDSLDTVDNFSEISSPHNVYTGATQKMLQRHLFIANKTLVNLGFIDDSELNQTAGNIPILGWDGSRILGSTYDLIIESFDKEQRNVLNKIDKMEGISDSERETLKHQYAAVQFTKNTENFPLPLRSAISSILSNVFGHSSNFITEMDEGEASKFREEFDDLISRFSSKELGALHAYGFDLSILGMEGSSKTNSEIVERLLEDGLTGVSQSVKDTVRKSLEKTQKKSKSSTESSTVGYYAEFAYYACMAAKSVPEGGSLDFEEIPLKDRNVKMKMFTVKDKDGKILHQFINHGNPSGLCDMAIIKFKDGKPSALLSSELKVSSTGTTKEASFNDLSGFSNILDYLIKTHGIDSLGLAGVQKIDSLNNGTSVKVNSGHFNITCLGDSIGFINARNERGK
jgi:hypothetical protein